MEDIVVMLCSFFEQILSNSYTVFQRKCNRLPVSWEHCQGRKKLTCTFCYDNYIPRPITAITFNTDHGICKKTLSLFRSIGVLLGPMSQLEQSFLCQLLFVVQLGQRIRFLLVLYSYSIQKRQPLSLAILGPFLVIFLPTT